jgi:hypothetical protein
LDPSDFRHPSLNHVDHFDCKLRPRKKHQYKNLMLACAACNQCKHDKPTINPLDKSQRLLNCTVENEFPTHIAEAENGDWLPLTKEAKYHLASIGLSEECHRKKRAGRRNVVMQLLALCKTAIQYRVGNPAQLHQQLVQSVHNLLFHLDSFPPLVTKHGLMTAKAWLKQQGVDLDSLTSPADCAGVKETLPR